MRALFLIWLFAVPCTGFAWQLALEGGLAASVRQGSGFAGTATGWDFGARWSRRPFVARRRAVDLTVGQFANNGVANGLLERGRIATATYEWEWRVPLTYDLRPWWGVGGGIARIRYDERTQTNARGYAVAFYGPTSETDATVQTDIGLRLSRSWSVSLVGATDWPAHISSITLTLLWRLL